ncbi:MAG: methyltransferase domain-containing protein, partial [Rhodomicrobium sp.]
SIRSTRSRRCCPGTSPHQRGLASLPEPHRVKPAKPRRPHDAYKRLHIPVQLIQAQAEALPLSDHVFDTIVTTWTLCTISEVDKALAELRRALKPTGQLLFLEHGRAEDYAVSRWQDALTHLTRPLNGGCRINRSIADLLTKAGFEILSLRTGYAGVIKPFVYIYEGCASPTGTD